ncbi:histone transcription regulator 1 [Lentinula raphanica]|nr:histone transcription regulator 1 [Lentinula raphanica]
MHFTKPAWVAHKDPSAKSDAGKRLSIFSVHVHPDGSRIATGGLDARVRIWSTKPILNPASEESNRPPKSLCTLTMHTGPVLTVRWAHSGRWLASGSDDEIVMIWDLDPNARGKVWGSDEVNVEGWKPMKRLPGHESDVTDVAWAPEDRYLASVGLDSKVLIWCGYTLERLHKLDQHQGFVKGVCWDPVGEFLATQSDDRSVKIWRTSDWSLEAEVKKPFEDSPGSTFFRRLSWSPDGAHITASNATNNKGFVFIAAVITRGTWTSDISLVGHENTVEVAAYNPHIFLRDPKQPVATSNICSVVALGADDRSVSVWQTKSARPLIVAKEVFDRQIMDLSWSWDGMTLYAASSDGTIAVFAFEPDELEGIAPHSVQVQYLSKFGFVPPPLPEGYSHESSSSNIAAAATAEVASKPAAVDTKIVGGEVVNVLVAKRNNKKRVGLTTMSSVPSAGLSKSTAKRVPFLSDTDIKMGGSKPASPLTRDSFFPTPDEQPFDTPRDRKLRIDVDMGSSSGSAGYKSLSGNRQREMVPVKEISISKTVSMVNSNGITLPVPAILTRLTAELEGGVQFQAMNSEDGGSSSLSLFLDLSTNKRMLELDYLPSSVIAVQSTSRFFAVAMLDGSIIVYSPSGRRLMPTLKLGAPCSIMECSESCLLVITQDGTLYSWNVARNTAFFPPTSIASLISPNDTITSSVRPNGTPIIHCSSGAVYSYDPMLFTWVKITDRWWSQGSELWRKSQTQPAHSNIVAQIENNIRDLLSESSANSIQSERWDRALTLNHLQARMQAAKLLDSPVEYKQNLALYAKKLADTGLEDMAEELIKDLCGPIFWHSGEGAGSRWSPNVVGLSKRDLLKDVVLSQFIKSEHLQELGREWQDILNKLNPEL